MIKKKSRRMKETRKMRTLKKLVRLRASDHAKAAGTYMVSASAGSVSLC